MKTENWRLEPHCCRSCFGRIASRPLDDLDDVSTLRVFACTNCGLEATGRKAHVLCACGMRIYKNGASKKGIDAGLRCHKNKNPSPSFPSLYVATYAAAQGGDDA